MSGYTREWETDEAYVACSGNFTIERALEGRFGFHSNDVSIYTCVLGAYLANGRQDVRVREERRQEWGFLDDYLKTPADRAATVMLGTSAFVGVVTDNSYYRRIRQAYQAQWAEVHAKTVEKLEAVDLRLRSFTPADAAEWVHAVPDEAALLSFPPFYEGGYEQLYKGLDEILDWDPPSYEVMDAEGLQAMLDVMESKQYWLYGTDHRVEGRESHLRGIVESKGNVPIFVYSSHGRSKAVTPRTEIESVPVPRLGDAQELGDSLELAVLNAKQYAALRAQYLAPTILGGTPRVALAVLCDGALVGVVAFTTEDKGRADAFLLADFPVAPTKYPRLSKLMVYVALSREARILAERGLNRRVRTIVTSAFSDRPVSMKYRGLLDLRARHEDGGQGRKYRLVYGSQADRWSLAEAFNIWKEKYGSA